ncbi:MAG: hypothetical protein BWZ02_03269 [Lentisphaerae bacterium ADurb.BinA184]|nr:MAG: hypothetical protein BWZ02_03269 [Lentisphaerae bacterium ADurb.BinA184]
MQTELPAGGGAGRAGEWRRTFANLQHGGDWDCDRTAMLNLAHQFERRTGSLFPFQSRAVAVTDAESLKAPFLFMSGHTPVEFTEPEAKALRAYLEGGGYLWINDSTDLGDDAFDGSVRRQLARLFPGAELKPIPMNHPIFAGPYDLSGGFRGFQVPPGDKYRSDHLEGLWLDGRLAVVYTRNDYGDGLEIDLKTAPLMQSLTDLTPLEMQEASIQMGINLASYFINRGRPVTGRLTASLPPGDGVAPVRPPPEAARTAWLDDPAEWRAPREDSPDYLRVVSVRAAAPPRLGISVTFDDGGKPFLPRRSKVILDRDGPLALDGRTVLVLAVHSRLAGGAQVALGFSGTGPVPYLETAAAFVRPGHSRELVFDLRRPILKSEQNEWRADGAFPEGFAVQTLHLLVYPQSPSGTIDCTEIRIAAPPAP